MSSAGARLNVTPTVTTLAVIKSRLAGAQRGLTVVVGKGYELSRMMMSWMKTLKL